MTEFYGNSFFIHAFLVSVGLLFDPALMFQCATIRLALGFAAALIFGKAVAALSAAMQSVGVALPDRLVRLAPDGDITGWLSHTTRSGDPSSPR